MSFWKNITILLLACITTCQIQAQGLTDHPKTANDKNDEWLLMTYLSKEQASSVPKLVIQDLINKGQVFFLNYEREEPVKDDSDRKNQQVLVESLSKRGVFAVGISGHRDNEIYPGLSATFSKLSTYNNPDPKNWLEQMKEPINAGYELKSVHIVYQPSIEKKKQSFEKSKKVMTQIVSELEKVKSDYKQFSDYKNAIISDGNWNDETKFPTYPGLFYRYGYGKEIPNSKGFYEKTTKDWCNIRIGIVQVNGLPKAQSWPSKMYSRQGIEAYWEIESENLEFNKRISDIIIKSLAVLDEYEQELEKSQSASSVATKIKESSEKLRESDRELNKKWDLPANVIAKTPTDKLFLHFIQSPMVVVMTMHSSVEAGVQRLLDSSATLHEFYTRNDMAQGALKVYREYDLSPESMSDESIKEVFSRDPRILENPETKKLLAPDNIVKTKITNIALRIYHADMLMQSKQFFPKLKGYEKQFLEVMLHRYAQITELQKKYNEDFSAALSCGGFCLHLAENYDQELYNKLKNIHYTKEPGQKQFYDEIRKYLGK